MARGFQGADLGPWRLVAVTLSERPRLRIQRSVAEVVDWLKADPPPDSCLGRIGPSGVFTLVEGISKEDGELAARLKEAGPVPMEAGSPGEDYARFLASIWRINIGWESRELRVTFSMPEDARKLGFLPLTDPVAALLTPTTIEIWRPEELLDLTRKVARELPEIRRLVEEDLE